MVQRSGVARLVGSVALGVAVCLASPAARAEEAGKASALAQAAAVRARQGDVRVAIDLYDEAYALAPRPEYLLEIAKLYDALASVGDSRDVRLAILYYERSIAGEAQTAARAEVEANLLRLRGWKARMRPEPQPPPPPPAVPVHFLSYRPNVTYDIEAGQARCATPCTIPMVPGPAVLKATGPGTVDLQLVVPPHPSQIRLQHADSSSFVAGIVMLPVGLVVATGMWAVGLACGNDDGGCQLGNFVVWPVLGVATLVTGIVLLAHGRGAPPPDANRVEILGRSLTVRPATFALSPLGGGGGGASGVRVSF